ncbi:hypothetical protein GCM10010193_64460 [Kitasatospora atroaurantiaca]|uniref:Uncharacterized protein n=1 Tax=Kitasatospora atroaurantiaca TaxID=285545 RepID=A0A561EMA6_9ACTN|nr:hypothetical protein [Kitasatospora atroaurantiaca]TWE16748.1 hypothetical protein FB465_1738 [Kitasatospora atroaurantiaca]
MTITPTILDLQLYGGRWDGHLKRVRSAAPPPSLRMVLRAELPATETGEYWPTTSVYRLEDEGSVWHYRHSHDE